jgi:type VI secretion system protein ImpC
VAWFYMNLMGWPTWQRVPEDGERNMAKSKSEEFISRRRRPQREGLGFNVNVANREVRVELPFVMGVISDLSGDARHPLPPVGNRKFLAIDLDNFDARMKAIRPRAIFAVPNVIRGEGDLDIDLRFETMDDFFPAAIVRRIAGLRTLLEARTSLSTATSRVGTRSQIDQEMSGDGLLRATARPSAPADSGVEPSTTGPIASVFDTSLTHVASNIASALELLAFLERTITPMISTETREEIDRALAAGCGSSQQATIVLSDDAIRTIQALVARIDSLLTTQVNLILHHERFRVIESAWRGLSYLVANTETSSSLKIRVLDLSKKDLAQSLSGLRGMQQPGSSLFVRIYEETFGTIGGEPFGCLVADYYFDHAAADIDLLQRIARLAAVVHAPLIAGAAPTLLGMASWRQLVHSREPKEILAAPEYARWHALRPLFGANYIALAMPRFLGRLPYEKRTNSVEEFAFEEDAPGNDYVWINAAYAMAVKINRSFGTWGSCSRIRGMESDGLVDGLPVQALPCDDGGIDESCPTEIGIGDRLERKLADCGLMPLSHRKNTDIAGFVSAHSIQMLPDDDGSDAVASARLAAQLPCLFEASRVAHYVMCLNFWRRVEAFSELAVTEHQLSNWLAGYVLQETAAATAEELARRPLSEAQLTLEHVAGVRGVYRGSLRLCFHDEDAVAFTLPLWLPADAGGPYGAAIEAAVNIFCGKSAR